VEDTNQILEPGMTIENPYRSVIEGFVCHLGMLPTAEQEKQRQRFSIITNNTALASKLDRIRCPATTVAVRPPQT